MDADFVMTVVFRWLHILPAIVAVGAAIFMRFALLPACQSLGDEQRAALLEEVRARWARWVMLSILLLLVSGFYNFITINNRYDVPKAAYHSMFLIKFLLALAIFYIASLLTGRSEAAQRFRRRALFWLNVNVALAVVLVCISGAMRTLPHPPKEGDAAEKPVAVGQEDGAALAEADGSKHPAEPAGR